MAKLKNTSVGRRGFLKGAAAGAAVSAATLVTPQLTEAQQQGAGRGGRGGGQGGAPQPDGSAIAREDGTARPAPVSRIVENPGSDYMCDVIKALGIEYVSFNPGSSFEGLHESLINYTKNNPEIITCTHEENAVAMAHGYAKACGKPMLALLHGTIGVQHAAMAIYNAYGDRVPIVMIAGVGDTAVPAHTAVDLGAMVRDFVKWDHQPDTLTGVGQALIRAYKLAMTPPMAPVLVTVQAELQMGAMPANRPQVPKFTMPSAPSADLASVRQIAKDLVNATNPRIAAGRVRTQEGMDQLVQLADLLQCPVAGGGDRMTFPNRHPMAGNGAGGAADVILSLEAGGGGGGGRGGAAGGKTIVISTAELLATHNYNINGNGVNGDVYIAADPEATLPALIEEVQKLMTPDKKRLFEDRGKKHAEANRAARATAAEAASVGWNASPVSLARIAAELWPLIKNEDWSYVSPQNFAGNWANRLWDMKKIYHYLGGQGAGGMGYGAPASVGAALANRKNGRISINIQTDGDMNYSPGILWTAAHHRIPLLSIMHNNRGYHQEVMFIARAASIRNRGQENSHIGTRLIDPNIDYAMMAKAYGMYSEGPITDPKDLAPAFKRGIERVKKGEPVMIDVVTQPRG
ncbi:MAG: thiamine pyrophosphate enzyme domain protein TPP-binding [Bryobacterales bacterium]|nr:thiamine pyrophosphate enzyme domain protein TPP-binding [Bryobacterales bacterium]